MAFPSTNFADTSERMTFSKQKQSFQILAPSNHQLWKNKHQTIFGSEIHLPHQFSSRFSSTIIDFFKPKASTSGHVLGIYVNLIVFFFLIVLPENQTKGRTNTKCQYPPLLHNLPCSCEFKICGIHRITNEIHIPIHLCGLV